MKTKCMSCGRTTKKMQKGGPTDSTKKAPYVSPSGAFYPDSASLASGCAKNPNSPECKKVIKKMSPAEAAKIKGRLQKGGVINKMQKGGSVSDSTAIYRKRASILEKNAYDSYWNGNTNKMEQQLKASLKATDNEVRQANKGKKGYDKMGFPLPKKKYTTNELLKNQKGGVINKMQKGGPVTKSGQKINFPPIPKREAAQESAQATKLTAFEKRQNKKIAKAKTRSAVASIEGEGSVSQKRYNRADRISTIIGTRRMKVPKTLSTSTTTNTTIGSNNTSSNSNSGVEGSGNSQNANATNNNSNNQRKKGGAVARRYQNGGSSSSSNSNSSVNNSGNSTNNNTINNNSNNTIQKPPVRKPPLRKPPVRKPPVVKPKPKPGTRFRYT